MTVLGDVAVLLLIVLFGFVGKLVHDSVYDLRALGTGIRETGASVRETGETAGRGLRDGLGAAAGAVEPVPIVGGRIADALRQGGDRAAGVVSGEAAAAAREIDAAGAEGQERAEQAADVLGWTIFVVPVVLLLSRTLPPRVRQVQKLTTAERVLRTDDPERVRALAHRAAFALPYATLLRYTRDPLGDLIAGRHDRLVDAIREDAGLSGRDVKV